MMNLKKKLSASLLAASMLLASTGAFATPNKHVREIVQATQGTPYGLVCVEAGFYALAIQNLLESLLHKSVREVPFGFKTHVAVLEELTSQYKAKGLEQKIARIFADENCPVNVKEFLQNFLRDARNVLKMFNQRYIRDGRRINTIQLLVDLRDCGLRACTSDELSVDLRKKGWEILGLLNDVALEERVYHGGTRSHSDTATHELFYLVGLDAIRDLREAKTGVAPEVKKQPKPQPTVEVKKEETKKTKTQAPRSTSKIATLVCAAAAALIAVSMYFSK